MCLNTLKSFELENVKNFLLKSSQSVACFYQLTEENVCTKAMPKLSFWHVFNSNYMKISRSFIQNSTLYCFE